MSAAAESLLAVPIAGRTRPQWQQWRQWLIAKILYDTTVDRQTKARARIGLTILAFAIVYSIIAVRLVLFGVASNNHAAHRVV